MNFELSPQLQELRARVRAFVDERIIPREQELVTDSTRTRLKALQAEAKQQGLWTPHLPKELVAKLNKSTVDFLQSPEGRAKFGALSLDIIASTPQVFEAHLKAELEKWGKVVKAAGLKPE